MKTISYKIFGVFVLVVGTLLVIVSISRASEESEKYRNFRELQRQEYGEYVERLRSLWGVKNQADGSSTSMSSTAEESRAEESGEVDRRPQEEPRHDDEAYMEVLRSFWSEMIETGQFKYHKYGSNHESDVDFDRGMVAVEGHAEASSMESAIDQALDHVIVGTKESILTLGFKNGGTVEDRLERAGLLSDEGVHSFILEHMEIDENAFEVEVGEGGKIRARITAQVALLGKEAAQAKQVISRAEATEKSSIPEATDITGLIVDASSMKYHPTIAPEIVSTHWRKVYRIKDVDPAILAAKGAAAWAGSVEDAKKSARAGTSPVIVKPIRISNRNALVISREDRSRIVKSDWGKKALQKANVVIVIDPFDSGSLVDSTEASSAAMSAMHLSDHVSSSVDKITDKNWHSLGPYQGGIAALAIDHTDPEVFYAMCVGGLFKSMDGGRSWMVMNRGIPYPINTLMLNYSIAIDQANPETLYTGFGFLDTAENGVFKSVDGGKNWISLGLEHNVTSIAVSPSGIVFAGTFLDGVHRNTDGGENWERLDLDVFGVDTILVNPHDPEVIYLMTNARGFYVSRDGGDNWILSSKGLPDKFFVSFAVDPSDGDHLYLGRGLAKASEAALYHSTDGGEHWEPMYLPEPPIKSDYSLSAIAIDPKDSAVIYVARDDTILKTKDRGETWEVLKYIFPEENKPGPRRTTCLAVGPGNSNIVYAGSSGGFPSGLYKSVNGGTDWKRVGVPSVKVMDVASCRKFEDEGDGDSKGFAYYIYALSSMGLFRARDGGVAWEELYAIDGARALTIDPRDQNVLLVGREARDSTANILRSVDGGESFERVWSSSDYSSEGTISAIAFDPHYMYNRHGDQKDSIASRHAYVCMIMEKRNQCSLLKSEDNGQTWFATGFPTEVKARSIAVDPRTGGVIYIGADYYGVLKSEDGGENWVSLGPQGKKHDIISLAVDPHEGQTLLAGGEKVFFRSVDGGLTWERASEGLPAVFSRHGGIHALAFDLDKKGVVYAGTTGSGVFVSNDNGLSWTAFSQGLNHQYVTVLGFELKKLNRLLAGTNGGGLFAKVVGSD